jgi:integrase
MRSQRPYSASYLDTNRAIAKNEIARFPAFQEKTLAELSAGAIRSYQLSLFNAGKSADRINKIIHALSVPLRDAYERGELDSNPLAAIKDLPVTRKEKGILTDGEIEKLRAADIDLKLKAAIFLGLFSGLRLGEVRGLLWRDLEYAHINVRHNFQTKDGLKNPKYDSFGKTPLPKETKNLLEKLPRDSTYVLSYNGGAIGYDWFNKGIHKAYKAIGVEREEQKERLLTFQSLRHTFATTSQIKYGLSPIEAMSVMRHKSQRMTYHYTHARQSPDSALEKMRAIGAHGKAHDFSTGRGMENEKNQKKLKKSPEFLKNAVMSQVKI